MASIFIATHYLTQCETTFIKIVSGEKQPLAIKQNSGTSRFIMYVILNELP